MHRRTASNGGAVYVFRRGSEWASGLQRITTRARNVRASRADIDVGLERRRSAPAATPSRSARAIDDRRQFRRRRTGSASSTCLPYSSEQLSGRARVFRGPNGGILFRWYSVTLSESGLHPRDRMLSGPQPDRRDLQIHQWRVAERPELSRGMISATRKPASTPTLSRDGTRFAELCFDPGSASRLMRVYIRVYSGSNWSVRTDINLDHPASLETRWWHVGLGSRSSGRHDRGSVLERRGRHGAGRRLHPGAQARELGLPIPRRS